MRKSIFSEYFYLCAVILSAAIICIGAVLLLVSGEFYKSEKKTTLIKTTEEVLATTTISIKTDGLNIAYLKNVFLNITDTTEIDFTLVDSNGDALVCSEAPPCFHTEKVLGDEILKSITTNGYYEIGKFFNYYNQPYFCLAYRIDIEDSTYYILSKTSTEPLIQYLSKLILILCIVSIIILIIVFFAIYLATKRLLTPIREMSLAARRFGDGDFSKRLYITEQNELGFLANSLNEMANSLEEIEETRKSFVSNVSHELKTPMTTIGGFVDGILDGTIPPEMHTHYLCIVSDEVARLSRLVRSMLNISKYESGELEMSTEHFNLMPILVKTALNFEKLIEKKNVQIIGIENPEFYLNADVDLFQQVAFNIIENAVKFVNDNGFIQFSFSETEDTSTFKIKNSGQGLSEREISKVFERFYKADASRGIDKTGVGLGLSIVRSIIKLHNGTILVRSEYSEYVEFEITLNKLKP